jgi:hypothetical protein
MPRIHGDEIKGEVVNANAGGGSYSVTLYDAGTLTARTQKATEFLTITDLIFISTAGGTYNLVFYPLATAVIADGAGLRIAKGNAEVLGGLAHHFETPITGPVGYGAALIAAAGQVDLVVSGFVSQG